MKKIKELKKIKKFIKPNCVNTTTQLPNGITIVGINQKRVEARTAFSIVTMTSKKKEEKKRENKNETNVKNRQKTRWVQQRMRGKNSQVGIVREIGKKETRR